MYCIACLGIISAHLQSNPKRETDTRKARSLGAENGSEWVWLHLIQRERSSILTTARCARVGDGIRDLALIPII